MHSTFQLALKYLNYYFRASNGKGHGIHSPFVFEFVTKILGDKTEYDAYKKVEDLRAKLLLNKETVSITDLGAGSAKGGARERSVRSIAANASKPKKFGQLLYRTVQKYKPTTILELGSSLGITTAYLASGNPAAKILSLEGDPAIAAKARQHLKQLQIDDAELWVGNFDELLAPALEQLKRIDFVFVDGNHRYEPTKNYFNQLLKVARPDTILVFDDIHWSTEMEQVWDEIKSNDRVKCTVDLFFLGFVFFREEFKEKQDFVIRF
jgi:predicted O-methyltransferase YrrM